MEGTDEEDEILREIDVYISNDPDASTSLLHLVQFPQTPSNISNKHPMFKFSKNHKNDSIKHTMAMIPDEARIKPKHAMLELDYSFDPAGASRHSAVPSRKQTYKSNVIPSQTHLAIGRWSDDGASVHLTPLYRTIQVRPSFQHFNDRINCVSEHPSANDADEEKRNDKTARPLQFKKKESEKAIAARKSSYAFKRESEESEEWDTLNVHGTGSEECAAKRKDCVCPPHKMMKELNLNGRVYKNAATSGSSYIQSLGYLPDHVPAVQNDWAKNEDPNSLVTTVTKILLKGYPIPITMLQKKFEPVGGVDSDDLLTACCAAGVLIRGNFLIKSSLCGALSGNMKDARDVLLLLMCKYGAVRRSQLTNLLKTKLNVSKEELNYVLQKFATQRTTEGRGTISVSGANNGYWEMKIEDFAEFSNEYPEVSQKFDDFWATREEELEEILNDIVDAN